MIKELDWDSAFFKRKIGELNITHGKPKQIEAAVEKAKADGFAYIICKLKSKQTNFTARLESLGFSLIDIGVTWAIETDRLVCKNMNSHPRIRKSVKIAVQKDIPCLKKITTSIFEGSRFYRDPFFSEKEADNLYNAWIENSVNGSAADVVLCIQGRGFVTGKKIKGRKGEIVLIGVKKGFHNKGIGTVLAEEALKWFLNEGVRIVSVRTQLANLSAMNFYLKLGCYIKDYDIVLSKNLL
ncbi:MAG: GNAT family N-acetyltransferase [Nitrospirota bacterium]